MTIKLTQLSLTLISTLLVFTGCGSGGTDDGAQSNNTSGVTINEILADNNSTNVDPDFAEHGDWIELKNTSSATVDLAGYGLSDKKTEVKWTFPVNAQLAANQTLLVWADGHDTNANAYHTNFKLKASDDNVVLFTPNGTQLEEVKFKDQRADISLAKNSNGEFILTAQPTPEEENVINEKALSAKPTFSLAEGVYTSAQTITLSAPTGAEIHYTIDGTSATINSIQYATTPITINANTEVKAVSKESGNTKLVSEQRSRWYIISNSQLKISEVLPDNNSTKTDSFGDFGDIIEIQNTGASPLNITGYGLGDSMKGAKWTFPAQTLSANEKLLVWADDKNTTTIPFHTNFKLSAKGDSAVLYDTSNQIIDFVKFENIEKDMSLNREVNGSFTIKTPSL